MMMDHRDVPGSMRSSTRYNRREMWEAVGISGSPGESSVQIRWLDRSVLVAE